MNIWIMKTRYITTEKGCARFVILIGRYAIKLPRIHGHNFAYGRLDSLCKGISQNIREYVFFKAGTNHVCPIVFHIHGFLNIMLRVTELTESEYDDFEYDVLNSYVDISEDDTVWAITEHKADSWGRLGKQIVSIDYSG